MKIGLNIYLKVYIYLVILRHIVKFITSIIELPLALSGVLSMPVLIWNSILSISMVYILINILRIKKWALCSFFCIQLVNVVGQSILFDEDFGMLFIVAIILCVFMIALLFLKNNGLTAWSLFFYNCINYEGHNSKDEHARNNIIENKRTGNNNVTNINNVPEEDFSRFLKELPLKGDGSLDYEKMSITQHFLYTCKIESVKVALKDLMSDIKKQEKTISEINKEIILLSGSDRTKMRDLLCNEKVKLDELMTLYQQYCPKKKGYKVFRLVLFIVCIALAILGYYFYTKANDKEITNNVVDKYVIEMGENIQLDSNIEREELLRFFLNNKTPHSILYSVLEQEGITKISTYKEYINYLANPVNRKTIFAILQNKGYSDFKSQLELDTYLGYENVCITFFVGEDVYDIPINKASSFEKQYPQAKVQVVIGNEIKILPIEYINSQDFFEKHSDFRFCNSIYALSSPNEKASLNKRLLYYCLLATENISRNELGCIDDFLESINSDEKLRTFYWKLRNLGFLECEIGSVDIFVNKIINE